MFRSTKYKQNIRKDLSFLQERWRSIRTFLMSDYGIEADPKPPGELIAQVKAYFEALETPFSLICTRSNAKFPNFKVAMIVGLELLDCSSYKKAWKLPKDKQVTNSACTMLCKMFLYNKWPCTPLLRKHASGIPLGMPDGRLRFSEQ
jgi:hypothetical protein